MSNGPKWSTPATGLVYEPEPPREHHLARMHREQREYWQTPEGKAEEARQAAEAKALEARDKARIAENAARAVEARATLVRHHAAKRRTLKIQRTPAWADFDAIRKVYEAAAELTRTTGIPHHVDHVLPLNGAKVSGLHVAQNLRPLPATDNMKKRNRYEPE